MSNVSDIGDVLSAMSVLLIFIFAAGIVGWPRKGDSENMKLVRRISRHTLTATLGCAVLMGLIALIVTQGARQ